MDDLKNWGRDLRNTLRVNFGVEVILCEEVSNISQKCCDYYKIYYESYRGFQYYFKPMVKSLDYFVRKYLPDGIDLIELSVTHHNETTNEGFPIIISYIYPQRRLT